MVATVSAAAAAAAYQAPKANKQNAVQQHSVPTLKNSQWCLHQVKAHLKFNFQDTIMSYVPGRGGGWTQPYTEVQAATVTSQLLPRLLSMKYLRNDAVNAWCVSHGRHHPVLWCLPPPNTDVSLTPVCDRNFVSSVGRMEKSYNFRKLSLPVKWKKRKKTCWASISCL